MVISKLLIPQNWKSIADKNDISDKDLFGALASYQGLEEKEHQERLVALKEIGREAVTLRKEKEVAKLPPVIKYLSDMLAALPSEEREILKAKAAQEKENLAHKKAEKPGEAEGEEEDESADYATKLLVAFQKLKSAKDAAFQFIVCDAKPFIGLALAKKITPKHKQELLELTKGKRFLPIGSCRFENGKYVFTLENPVTGLARRMQESIKNFTGKKLPIMVGTESVDAEEEKPGAAPSPAAPKTMTPEQLQKLGKAPEVWHQTRKVLMKGVDQLKAVVRKQFEAEGPDLVAEIDQNMKKLDAIFDTLDAKLAESLAKAHAAKSPEQRAEELTNSRAIIKNYLNYVASEKMIAHIDENPFGVKTNLKQTLIASLTNVNKTIG